MAFKFEKETEDIRGKIFFFSQDKKQVNMLEIKKGFSRGGHYHEFDSLHIIATGKIEYREEDIQKGEEMRIVIDSPRIISTPAKKAHLLTAIEDSVFFEIFNQEYSATTWPKYRNIVEDKIKNSN